MNKILLLTSDLNLKALVNLVLQYNFDIEIINKKSAATASDYVRKNHADIKCIIADEHFPAGGATKMAKETTAVESTIPVIALMDPFGKGSISKDQIVFSKVTKDTILEKLVEVVGEVCIKKTSQILQDEKHVPMKLELLLELDSVGQDCYIRLNEQKYVKILNKKEYFSKEDFDKYSAKGVIYFYVKLDDVDELLESFSGNLNTMLDLSMFSRPESLNKIRSKFSDEEDGAILDSIVDALNKADKNKLSYDEASHISSQSLSLIRKANHKFAQGSEVQNIAKATVLLSLSTISQAPELNNMFEKAVSSEDTYLNDHSVLLGSICCQIAGLLGWHSKLTHYKLMMAAMLHDITLDNSKLSRYRGVPDLMLDADQFNEGEIKSFLSHTERGKELIQSFRMIPPDTDLIISQHHERPDGTGFPLKINFSKISPLGSVFIVAHDLVSFIMSREKAEENKQKKTEWNMVSFLNQHRFLYQNGVFKDIFNVMWKHMVNKS
ncbi:MAG: hypothetical protein KAG61_10315 [Bacteriovoracaceae bacterium]|nr:hypothetical protein [Bacteriovoracaceae bacterium]